MRLANIILDTFMQDSCRYIETHSTCPQTRHPPTHTFREKKRERERKTERETHRNGGMPTYLSCPEVVREVEVSKEHGLNQVSLLHNFNMIPFVKGFNLIAEIAHYVGSVRNLFQTEIWK